MTSWVTWNLTFGDVADILVLAISRSPQLLGGSG